MARTGQYDLAAQTLTHVLGEHVKTTLDELHHRYGKEPTRRMFARDINNSIGSMSALQTAFDGFATKMHETYRNQLLEIEPAIQSLISLAIHSTTKLAATQQDVFQLQTSNEELEALVKEKTQMNMKDDVAEILAWTTQMKAKIGNTPCNTTVVDPVLVHENRRLAAELKEAKEENETLQRMQAIEFSTRTIGTSARNADPTIGIGPGGLAGTTPARPAEAIGTPPAPGAARPKNAYDLAHAPEKNAEAMAES